MCVYRNYKNPLHINFLFSLTDLLFWVSCSCVCVCACEYTLIIWLIRIRNIHSLNLWIIVCLCVCIYKLNVKSKLSNVKFSFLFCWFIFLHSIWMKLHMFLLANITINFYFTSWNSMNLIMYIFFCIVYWTFFCFQMFYSC